ncbi:hypothetical protein CC80DRAFT_402281 [Byssothecium circinans]|uniref:HOOK N-terminal domain-containing protein n=1 Tax=Byssothecium circinans TaxID=147558 RepID=A0A6A5U916_9PLEO|nr:hypothetical protein CC80DRAFT_402281 [Byssothecium circinans]
MDDFKPDLLKALLDWVNTFDLPGRVTAWNQLEDGQILWQILNDVDPNYFNDSLPNLEEGADRRRSITDSWIPKWQNLKHIERAVSTYLREECEKLPVLSKRMIPDLKTGARDGSMMLTAKLTMAVLVAACTSPKSGERMLGVMAGLGESANVIGGGIQDLLELDKRMAELGVEKELTAEPNLSGYRTPQRAVSGTASAIGRDNDLEQEAQLFEANKDRNALRAQVTKLQGDVEKSKGRISQLEEELVEARLHLDDRGAKGAASDEVERLRNDLLRERQYIDRLETDHANAKDVIESLKKRAARFEAEYEAKQELRDQLQLVRAERDELEKKAKANENLKKKIESLSKESKSLEIVRQELQQAKERLQDLEEIEEKCTALEKVNKENIQTLINSEQSIYEEKGKRNRLEHDNLMLMKELEQTKEFQYKAEEAKRELEDRIRELESHGGRGGSLEDELEHEQNVDNLEVASSAKISSDGRVSADAIALQQRVEVLTARLRSMETETLKQMQENLGLKSDMLASKDEENQKPFLEQNQKLQTAEAELQELHRRLREKDLQNAELQNELNKKSDVEEDVKNKALQTEHDRLLALQDAANKKLRDLEVAKDESRALLLRALLDRDNLSPELVQIQLEETLRKIKEQIEGVIKAPSETQPKVLDVTSHEIADRVGRSRAALETVKRDLEDQRASNDQLREQLEKAEKEGAEKGSAELQTEVENLRRENKLINSAWYDMTTRLQSNTVILQRKSEVPRSWLGKQRAAVGRVGAVSHKRLP